MTTRHAACSCGQLRLVAEGEPVRVSMCHCLDCQRRSGAPFAAQARFAKDKVGVEGRSNTYVRTNENGNRGHFDFCPACGVTIRYVTDAEPELVAVPIGVFADPSFPAPTVSVYEERKHAWVTAPADAEHIF